MRAWVVRQPGPIDGGPLRLVEMPVPTPGETEVLVRVSVCGVCRTDLHLAEGDLPPRRAEAIPGHEVVGTIEAVGTRCHRFAPGQRVGAAWLASTCGACRFCVSGRENLCLQPRFTGWDVHGGYAEYMVAEEDFVYPLPDAFDDVGAAPLLCAGIIGYRALRRSQLPAGGRLGLWGFGGSAHLTAQVAVAEGATLYVLTRSAVDQQLARSLGASYVGGSEERPPEPLDSAILFAPAGPLVLPALESLDRGGTLAVAGIHLTEVPALDYQRHLFQEKTLLSVTANTRRDGEEFLGAAERYDLRATTTTYPFDAVDQALSDLAHDRFNGAAVIEVADG